LWVFYDKYGTRGAFKEAKERKYGTFIKGVLVISGTLHTIAIGIKDKSTLGTSWGTG
jgi:hypothetical protein